MDEDPAATAIADIEAAIWARVAELETLKSLRERQLQSRNPTTTYSHPYCRLNENKSFNKIQAEIS